MSFAATRTGDCIRVEGDLPRGKIDIPVTDSSHTGTAHVQWIGLRGSTLRVAYKDSEGLGFFQRYYLDGTRTPSDSLSVNLEKPQDYCEEIIWTA